MRYISRVPAPSRSSDWWDKGGPEQITVHEADPGPQWTGLLDMHGNELCRVPDRAPMGFRLK